MRKSLFFIIMLLSLSVQSAPHSMRGKFCELALGVKKTGEIPDRIRETIVELSATDFKDLIIEFLLMNPSYYSWEFTANYGTPEKDAFRMASLVTAYVETHPATDEALLFLPFFNRVIMGGYFREMESRGQNLDWWLWHFDVLNRVLTYGYHSEEAHAYLPRMVSHSFHVRDFIAQSGVRREFDTLAESILGKMRENIAKTYQNMPVLSQRRLRSQLQLAIHTELQNRRDPNMDDDPVYLRNRDFDEHHARELQDILDATP